MADTTHPTSDCKYVELEVDEEHTTAFQRKPVRRDPLSYEDKNPKQVTRSILFALLASVAFALNNYILGNKSSLGMLAREATEGGPLLYAIIYFTYCYLKSVWDDTTFWSWETSNFRDANTGGFHWVNFIGLCFYVAVNVLAGFAVVYTFKFALYANINQGILTTLFGLSAIFSAFLAYFIFGEKLKIPNMIGIVLMLLCIIGLSLGSTKKYEENLTAGTEAPLIYGFLAIALGTLCPVLFSTGGMTVRIIQEKTGYQSGDLTVACYLGTNVVLLPAMVFTYIYGTHPFIFSEYCVMVLAGVLAAIGVASLNYALTIGYAGPVFAIANTQVILTTFLDAMILGQIPSMIEILSAILGITGSFIIAIGPQIYDKCMKLCGKGKTD